MEADNVSTDGGGRCGEQGGGDRWGGSATLSVASSRWGMVRRVTGARRVPNAVWEVGVRESEESGTHRSCCSR